MIQKYFVIFLCLMCTFTPPAMAECECTNGDSSDCECGNINSTAGWTLRCDRDYIIVQKDTTYECQKCPDNYISSGASIELLDKQYWASGANYGECTMTTIIYDDDGPTGLSIDMTYNTEAPQILADYVNDAPEIAAYIKNAKKDRPNDIFMGLIDDAGRLIYDKDLNPTETEWTSNIAEIYLKWLEPKWEITICNYVGTTVDEECKNSTTHTITRAKPNLYLDKFGHKFTDEKGLFGYNENKEPVYYYTKTDGTTFTPVCQIKTPNCWLNTATAESTKIQLFAKWTPEEYKLEFICPTETQLTSATFGATLTEISDGPGYFYPTPCDASRQIGWIVENDGDIYCEEDDSTSCINNIFFPYNANAPESKQILNFKHSSGTITFVPKYTVTFRDNNGTFILQ